MSSSERHFESAYISRLFAEPLRDALTALLLHQPRDPIDFMASYLYDWVKKASLKLCTNSHNLVVIGDEWDRLVSGSRIPIV
ncbi:unnamed protein product [Protopolystoma xenopodis]|uniref:RIIa domain-containing protein n=1 Tax=Protopolystoma xenopodis TaxID=117903 RepID=A0A3S5C103_9PLAT|nr:unnamed protein product [Protopolystoma xenopodis]